MNVISEGRTDIVLRSVKLSLCKHTTFLRVTFVHTVVRLCFLRGECERWEGGELGRRRDALLFVGDGRGPRPEGVVVWDLDHDEIGAEGGGDCEQYGDGAEFH